MYVALLLCIQYLISSVSTFLNKRFQLSFRYDMAHFLWYNLLNAFLATVNYLISTGFRIQVNGVTLVFSVVYALVVINSLCMQIAALKYMSIPMYSVMSSAGAMITSSAFAFWYLQEPFTISTALALLLVVAAVTLPWLRNLRVREKTDMRQLLLSAAVFATGGLSNITCKLYAVNPAVCDEKQFFLMTNVVIMVLCGIASGIYFLSKGIKLPQIAGLFGLKQLGNIAAITAVSNIGSVVSITLLGLLPLSGYNVISSAISMGAGVVLSMVLFKEKPSMAQLIGVVLVVAATALCAL